ncbi:MAG: trigger factor [Acidobacteriota bacterium]
MRPALKAGPSLTDNTTMKAELVDLTETRKRLDIEIPGDQVTAEIDRITARLARSAKVPGFRPGKVPPRVIRQRFRDEIVHEVVHELVPTAVQAALDERDLDPVDTPDVRDVVVEDGSPLTFTASFEVVPPLDPGDYRGIPLRRKPAAVGEETVEGTLERLRQRAARFEPVEGRPLAAGDWAVVDLERQQLTGDGAREAERHQDVTIELGASANPPGFDEQLAGMQPGQEETFTVHYPADFGIRELAGADVRYAVSLKAIKTRVVPALDDEFAKDLGDFTTLDELRARVRRDLEDETRGQVERDLRGELLSTLAGRVSIEVPGALVEHELDRRLEDLVHRLAEQRVDPRTAGVDWNEVRASQRDAALESVKAALVLDEIARREGVDVSDEEIDAEIGRFAERSGRTVAAVRVQVEKDGGRLRLRQGLRREKTMDFLLSNAAITTA